MTRDGVKNNLGYLIAGLVVFAVATTVYFEVKHSPRVKKSPAGLCHDRHSLYYPQTLNYEPYASLVGCVSSGGRVPQEDVS